MSYICLLANENGAVCASDSRETSTFTRRYKDKRQKTYISDRKDAIWCCCGASRIGHVIYATDCIGKAGKILNDDSLPFTWRLKQFEDFISRETRKPLIGKKTVYVFTVLFAYWRPDKPPLVGTITAKGGAITDKRFFKLPIMMEAGKNSSFLSPRKRYMPRQGESLIRLSKKATARVREAIRYDINAKKADPSYAPTVGGKVQIEKLSFKKFTLLVRP